MLVFFIHIVWMYLQIKRFRMKDEITCSLKWNEIIARYWIVRSSHLILSAGLVMIIITWFQPRIFNSCYPKIFGLRTRDAGESVFLWFSITLCYSCANNLNVARLCWRFGTNAGHTVPRAFDKFTPQKYFIYISVGKPGLE